jgi:hypothetical protein
MVDKQVPVERHGVTSQKWNAPSVLVLVLAAVAFIMLFFSRFGPISSRFIPFHPWVGQEYLSA